jgi:DNA-binding NarL/FixJ family response regulator
LQAVADGFLVLSPEESAAIQTDAGALREPTEAIETLTTREKEVLQKIANGLANKEIAVRLNISEHTVKFHVASILGKLGASSRTEAVTIGMRRGLILV